jgi:hypothetical protein
MPSTVVHVAFGAIVLSALLWSRFDWKAVLLALFVVGAADLDAFAGILVAGGHRSVGHTLLLPGLAALLVYFDTRGRDRLAGRLSLLGETSRLRRRYGAYGVEVAWAGIGAFLFAAIGLDLVMGGRYGGVNLLWPVHDQFYRIDGRAFYSTVDGLQQTFVEVTRERTSSGGSTTTVDAGQRGTSEEVHIANPVEPERGKVTQVEERIFPIVASGWQLWMVVTGLFVLGTRFWRERVTERRSGERSEPDD